MTATVLSNAALEKKKIQQMPTPYIKLPTTVAAPMRPSMSRRPRITHSSFALVSATVALAAASSRCTSKEFSASSPCGMRLRPLRKPILVCAIIVTLAVMHKRWHFAAGSHLMCPESTHCDWRHGRVYSCYAGLLVPPQGRWWRWRSAVGDQLPFRCLVQHMYLILGHPKGSVGTLLFWLIGQKGSGQRSTPLHFVWHVDCWPGTESQGNLSEKTEFVTTPDHRHRYERRCLKKVPHAHSCLYAADRSKDLANSLVHLPRRESCFMSPWALPTWRI